MDSNKRLPNFVVAGAAKSGSTSLYEYIKNHPQIFLPEKKESRYFAVEKLRKTLGYDKTSVFDWDEFVGQYNAVEESHKAIGDFGNLYMIFPELAVENIKEKLGEDVKVVFIIRNPVKRAYSAYQMARRNFYEDQSFERGLELEEERLEKGYVPCDIIAYQKMGLYASPISFFKEHFPVHVIVLDDLKKDAKEELKKLFAFLEVDSLYEVPPAQVHNQGGEVPQSGINVFKIQKALKSMKPIFGFIPGLSRLSEWLVNTLSKNIGGRTSRKAEPLSPAMEERLRQFFRNDVEAMSKLLNRDLLELWGFEQSKETSGDR